METVLFKGCPPTYKTPEILKAAENLASGFEAVRKNIEKFKAGGVRRIITICPGCYNAFCKYYIGHDGFSPEIILAIDLLNGLTITGDDFTVQDPCHAKEKAYSVRMIVPSRILIEESLCCGAGGGVMAHDKSLAKLKARKAADNPEKIVTYCPFCYLNLSSVKPDKIFDTYMLLDNHLSNI